MKPTTALVTVLAIVLLSACSTPTHSVVKDFSVMSAEPYKWEVQRGYERFWEFYSHMNARTRQLLQYTPYIVVTARIMTANEVPGLAYRLGQGRSQEAAVFTGNLRSPGAQTVRYMIVFDSRTRRPVNDSGVFIVDSPPRGYIGVFGGISAIYGG
jgi:hypothetical protein